MKCPFNACLLELFKSEEIWIILLRLYEEDFLMRLCTNTTHQGNISFNVIRNWKLFHGLLIRTFLPLNKLLSENTFTAYSHISVVSIHKLH